MNALCMWGRTGRDRTKIPQTLLMYQTTVDGQTIGMYIIVYSCSVKVSSPSAAVKPTPAVHPRYDSPPDGLFLLNPPSQFAIYSEGIGTSLYSRFDCMYST